MKRRTLIGSAALLVSAGAGGYVMAEDGNVMETLGLSNSDIQSIEWSEDNKLTVSLADEHEIYGLAVLPPDGEERKDTIGDVPVEQYDTEVTIDVFSSLDSDDRDELGTWEVVGLDENFDERLMGEMMEEVEIIDSASFEFGAEIEVRDAEINNYGELKATVLNDGPAPIDLVEVDAGQTASHSQVLPPSEETIVETNGPVVERADDDPNCRIVPPELDLELRFRPQKIHKTTVDLDHDDEERRCVMSS